MGVPLPIFAPEYEPVTAIVEQPTIAAKLASGDLYMMTLADAEDRAHGGVYQRTDALTGVTYAYWRNGRSIIWQEVALDTPLCGGCDAECPDGICDRCAEYRP